MTLVELMMALAITAIVALAAAGMLSAVTYGSAERTDMRSLLVRQEMIAQRLSAAVRASRQVLDADDDRLILWVSDANHDDVTQVSEVRWIHFSENDGTLTSTSVSFPDHLTHEQMDALDAVFNPAQSMQSQLSGLGSYVVMQTWAQGVAGWELSSRDATEKRPGLLNFRVTFADQYNQRQTIIGAAALRSQ